MINKDYILRLAERFGRQLAIILRLRKFDQNEEALIYIDDLLLKSTGFTSRFLNSLSEEMLLQILSPLGNLNIEAALWSAMLLKAEGEIYEAMGQTNESYHRYIKSLSLWLEILRHENITAEPEFAQAITDLIKQLDDYELPQNIKDKLFAYYEHIGNYGKAEDVLFELLEANPSDSWLIERGEAFYDRLLSKGNADLLAGNLSREEAEEGLAQLKQMHR
ncbi:MAG TPA: DUF6483 family protein [Ktedonobacteraceae bacterium]|nr:DUF6483 family protein [Ktedonobacteraceae bacterium]